MNTKRWAAAGLAAFVVVFVMDLVFHANVLMKLYEGTADVWRPKADANRMMWQMTLGQAAFSALFAWMYAKGYEQGRPWLGQGLRFGLYVGLLVSIPYVCVWYVVLPVPLALAWGWFVAGMVTSLMSGVVVSRVYRA